MNVHFEGITFVALTPGCTFFHSDSGNSTSLHVAQGFLFSDIHWVGPWKYITNLTGGDNNSEWKFYHCSIISMDNNGVFLYTAPDAFSSGGTQTSDQFLNF